MYARGRRPASASGAVAELLGATTLGLVVAAAARQLGPGRRGRPLAPAPAGKAGGEARALHAAAALLGASVLVDSAVAHYRGSFENPGMVAPLLASLMTVMAAAPQAAAASPAAKQPHRARTGIFATALATGAAGFGFHLYNIGRRPGRWCWQNLFYAAPPGAPAALSLAGLLGLAAQGLRAAADDAAPRMLGLDAGRALSAVSGLGIAGTAAEAALLHFRGAFQNPFMFLPVTVPPLTAALMVHAAVSPSAIRPRLVRGWLLLTGVLGLAGVGFHAYGVSRQMGGWRNAGQNLLSGPPLSAPPGFAALALAGWAALSLLARARREPGGQYEG
jgi:hypothetical protein